MEAHEPRVIYIQHGETPLFDRYTEPFDTPVFQPQDFVYATPSTRYVSLIRPFGDYEGIQPKNLMDEFARIVVKNKRKEATDDIRAEVTVRKLRKAAARQQEEEEENMEYEDFLDTDVNKEFAAMMRYFKTNPTLYHV